jgi:hypothetical protein
MTNEPLLPTNDAAPLILRAPATLNTWRSRGRGPKYVKIGGRVLYRPQDLRDYIEANVIDPTHVASTPRRREHANQDVA